MKAKKALEQLDQAIIDGLSPAMQEFLKEHGETLERCNARIGSIFGLCVAELLDAGMTPEEIGVFAALTAQNAEGME
jgi:hypothetical protein